MKITRVVVFVLIIAAVVLAVRFFPAPLREMAPPYTCYGEKEMSCLESRLDRSVDGTVLDISIENRGQESITLGSPPAKFSMPSLASELVNCVSNEVILVAGTVYPRDSSNKQVLTPNSSVIISCFFKEIRAESGSWVDFKGNILLENGKSYSLHGQAFAQ